MTTVKLTLEEIKAIRLSLIRTMDNYTQHDDKIIDLYKKFDSLLHKAERKCL